MKEALTFELSGKNAFFKRPDVNANVYFTYNHIPKVTLLGLLGAICGYGGYHEQKRDMEKNGYTEGNMFPEFYAKLRHLQISLVPHGDRSYFPKKIQVFNNSVGYASQEAGNNLIVKEQWLDRPSWTIYILNDGTESFLQLKELILASSAVYLPYLGKNDHPANILNPRVVELQPMEEVKKVDSLFQDSDVQLGGFARGEEAMYYYRERLPYALDKELNGYLFKEMICTNRQVKGVEETVNVFSVENHSIVFY